MKASIYLFRAEAADFSELLRDFPPGATLPETRNLTTSLDVPCEVWVMPAQPKPPSWAGALSSIVDVSDLRNASNSVLVLYLVGGRYFAVCFGYAHSLLNSELLEPEFGLRVTANVADPDKVAAMQVRTVSENSRQQRSQTANRSQAVEFDLELEREWLRYLKADVAAGFNWASSVGGSQSLSLTTKKSLEEFSSEVLTPLLDAFQSDGYKQKFPYLDNFAPVPKGDPILDQLWGRLAVAVSQPGTSKIGVACPDDLVGADVAYWRVYGDGGRREPIEDLTYEAVIAQIPPGKAAAALEKLKITPYNAGDAAIRSRRPLREYFVFEVEISGATYVLCLGQWFRVASSYVEEINEQVSRVQDITAELSLPKWDAGIGTKEEDYNEEVCKRRGYILLDKKNFYIGGPHQKVEVCDFLTQDFDFVCVKKMESSATMSHLFSQASVSAELYEENPPGQAKNAPRYGDHVRALYTNKWGDVSPVEKNRRMVLAIATDKSGDLANSLYFFSKVNLVQKLSDLRRSGFSVALAKVDR